MRNVLVNVSYRRLLLTQICKFSSSAAHLGHKQNEFVFEESKLVGKMNREQIPVAIVLGWAGSKDKHIEKYSKIHTNFGYHTIRIAPSAFFSLFQANKHKPCIKFLLDSMINEYKLNKNPLAVHTLSDAGILLYRHLIDFSNNEQKYLFFKSNLKSIIHDSGPGYLHPSSILIHSVADILSQNLNKYLSYTIAFIGVALFRSLYETQSGENNYFTQTREALLNDQTNVPMLFFLSKQDRLIDYKTTLTYIERKKLQLPQTLIDFVCFEDTEHVKHYTKYKELYLEKLKKHLLNSNLLIYN